MSTERLVIELSQVAGVCDGVNRQTELREQPSDLGHSQQSDVQSPVEQDPSVAERLDLRQGSLDGIGCYAVVASMTPLPKEVVLREPNRFDTASVDVTLWEVRAITQNISDIWARWQGRAIYRQPLPQLFWHYPGYTLGLAGSSHWRDIFPVVGSRSVEYMVGVSAWCNTPESLPSEDECCAARQHTWWNSTIEARKVAGSQWTTLGSDQINLSYHNSATFTTSSATYNGRCVAQGPALCGWETGPNCS